MRLQTQPPRVALVAFPRPESDALYRRLLVPCRLVVETASTGPEALAKALALRPDVLIAETGLHVINGFVLRNLLRSDPDTRDLPIVLVTPDDETGEARWNDRTIVLPRSTLEQRLCEVVTGHAVDDRPFPARAGAPRPALPPPELRCTRCDGTLLHQRTYWGGVPKQLEQWDVYACPAGCGTFEYRHRTRTLRALPRHIPDVPPRQSRVR